MLYRRIIREPVVLSGTGVRCGRAVTVRLEPVRPGEGLLLRRADASDRLPLSLASAFAGPGFSAVGTPDSHVAYVEHLMAALAAHGVTDAEVVVDGGELPLLEGSARPWWDLLEGAGVIETTLPLETVLLREPVAVHEGEAFLLALPADHARFTYLLDHEHPLVGSQWAEYLPGRSDFARELASAPTFTTWEEAQQAQELGLFPGGSAENAVIIYPDHFSRQLPWPNSCARHKLLDLVGDLYLLNRPVCAEILGYRSGHRLNQALARELQRQAYAPSLAEEERSC